MIKSNLEKFATIVAEKTLDVKVDELHSSNKGIDIAAILAFIETLATVIQSVSSMCPNKSKLAQIAKNPSFTQRIMFRAEVRKSFNESDNFLIKRAHIKAAQNAINEAANMSEEDLIKIVEETELIDNGII
jgi:hypothetical protein